MKLRALALTATVLCLLPASVVAQADWTLTVPLQVDRLPQDIAGGAVVCVVTADPSTASSAEAISQTLPYQLSNTVTAYSTAPGEAFPEFDGVNATDGFVGYQTFDADTGGGAPSSVIVEVAAHPDATDGSKSSIRYYACALALSPAADPEAFHPVHPNAIYQSDIGPSLESRAGAPLVGWVGGSLGNQP